MAAFVKAVNEVLPSSSFQVFERPVKSGREGETVTDWTDLHGFQKRKLIEELPQRYKRALSPNSQDAPLLGG